MVHIKVILTMEHIINNRLKIYIMVKIYKMNNYKLLDKEVLVVKELYINYILLEVVVVDGIHKEEPHNNMLNINHKVVNHY